MPAADRPGLLGEGRFLRLLNRAGWEYVERRGASAVVAIVAITDEAELILAEQYRPPVGRSVIELPAGLVGDQAGHEEEALETAARRELLEETGFEARTMVPIGQGPPSAGLSSEIVTFFRADGLRRVAAGGGDASEAIQVHPVPLVTVEAWLEAMAARGTLVDPKVYAGLFLAERHGPVAARGPRADRV